ncbi:hypothetical protein N7532_000016 [Penicillium argentinense]|uniref:Sulfatase N-terminal domain-containing protein n=1 Tax=Penicillium argentinense TaxID=1131581 RepID=A0A9W9G4F1_9EURO|nr:uncharacterized protein N7532_000016 [Penicillium argentinense]KAJ5111971.1 hypothetical protein N7532_000016 [Penicillium argentinense]
MRSSLLSLGLLLSGVSHCAANCGSGPGHGQGPHDSKKPNIVFILSDDQDARLGSTDFQSVLHKEIFDKGIRFINHFGTTAQCCPSRAGLLRGQVSHNTNITHVHGPGGNYDKWYISGQDKDYLPQWLAKAGYRSEYAGKLLNGYNIINYNIRPKGWHWVDALLDPYTTYYNVPVLSQNGERPTYYKGWHSTDVIRIKALDRLERLASQDQPFYLQIAPYSCHIENDQYRAIPLKRHFELFQDAKAPRYPNYNPEEKYQKKKGSWLRDLPLMNQSSRDFADFAFKSRAQSLQGVDEIIEDVIAKLEEKGILDNTYIVYSSDNGYHIGQNRVPAGKAGFYAEDTNLPFGVRGPGIPAGAVSKTPSVHVDLAPTFLDIAGLPEDEWPDFLDGASLLDQWRHPHQKYGEGQGEGNSKETLNIEFWGLCISESPNTVDVGSPFNNNSYKTLRILGEEQGWLLSIWCTGDIELYDTIKDPYEVNNIASSTESQHINMLNRLNTLLLVTKSCEKGSCRDPWAVFNPPDGSKIISLKQALDPKYDDFFASFPKVQFGECMQYQYVPNEEPYYPEIPVHAREGLGREARGPTDNYISTKGKVTIKDSTYHGTEAQRHGTLKDVYENARPLTDSELVSDDTVSSKRFAAVPERDLVGMGFD